MDNGTMIVCQGKDSDVIIPSQIDDCPVAGIGCKAFNSKDLVIITIGLLWCQPLFPAGY
jgi:hypothetical protein